MRQIRYISAVSQSASSGVLCNIGYSSETVTHLKLKSRELLLPHIQYSMFRSYPNTFAMIVPSSVRNFKPIAQLKRMLWTNEISRDLCLRWVSEGYPLVHSPTGSDLRRTLQRNACYLSIGWRTAIWWHFPDSKAHGANMGPIWGRQDPGGTHVGPIHEPCHLGMPEKTHYNI